MKLHHVTIKNFKKFQKLELDFEGKNCIITGINGSGKSSLISAINFCLWGIVKKLHASQTDAYRVFNLSHFYNGIKKPEIQCEIEDSKIFTLSKKFNKGEGYDKFIFSWEEKMFHCENLPVIISYGTHRTSNISLKINKNHQNALSSAFERSVNDNFDFKIFFEWFRNQEDLENEYIRESGQQDYEDFRLKHVRQAIYAGLNNIQNLKVKRNPLRITVQNNSAILPINQLSDGEKDILCLFGDIARRLCLANSYQNENPLNGKGIVLIDEIGLYLHSTWQKNVLENLQKTFPNIQFIVTAKKENNISQFNTIEIFSKCYIIKNTEKCQRRFIGAVC